jgi:hypothetical protein
MADPVAPSGSSSIADATALQDIATNGSLLNQATSRLIQSLERMANLVLPAIRGGTGISSYTIGDLLYANSTTTLAKLPDVVAGKVLVSGGVGVAPAYGDVPAGGISGVVPVPNGGTGFGSYAVGDILYANTTTTLAKLPDVATGNALISGGVGVAPSYGKVALSSAVSGQLPLANGGTGANLTDPNADRIMFWDDSAGFVDWLTPGTGLSITGTTLNASVSATWLASKAATGATVDFTGIPAGVSTIYCVFEWVSGGSSDTMQIQIGDSGGIETTGYVSTGSVTTAFTTSLGGSAAETYFGVYTLMRLTGNFWIMSGSGVANSGTDQNGAGTKTLSDTLTQVRFLNSGAGSFDAGTFWVGYI